MKKSQKILSRCVLGVGLFSIPLLLLMISFLVVIFHPELSEPQTIFDTFPQWILLVILLGIALIGSIFVASIVRQIPPRWWWSLFWCGGAFVLSLAAIYSVMRLCEPRQATRTIPTGSEFLLVIITQLLFGFSALAAGVAKLASR